VNGSGYAERAGTGRGGPIGRAALAMPLETAVRAVLSGISDPEIPGVSIVDLGIVRNVEVGPGRIRVELLPTFVGCPAIGMIQSTVVDHLRPLASVVDAAITYAEPWTSARITPEGRRKLRERGFAPPVEPLPGGEPAHWPLLPLGECPYCGSRNTTLENAFGPTACRAIYQCHDCCQPFEQFKVI
jgi:ring-1,2-phenylacetyl-CoA epoxidase subunit PaaD